jgi:hypothetical protein
MALDWLRRLMAKPGWRDDDSNAESIDDTLDEAVTDKLWEAIEPLDQVNKGLARDTFYYVLEGRCVEVLETLVSLQPGQLLKLKLTTKGNWRHSRVTRFFAAIPSCPAAVAYRLGVVCAACQKRSRATTIPWLPDVPSWLECLIWEAASLHPSWQHDEAVTGHLCAASIAAALEYADEDPKLLARILVRAPRERYFQQRVVVALRRTPGIAELLARYPSEVQAALEELDARTQVHLLETLREVAVSPVPWIETLTRLACSRRKTVRCEAVQLLESHWPMAHEALRTLLNGGSVDERVHAAELLARHGDDNDRELLRSRLAEERSQRVKSVIARALDSGKDETRRPARAKVVAPERPPLPAPAGPRPGQVEAVATLLDHLYRAVHGQWQGRQKYLSAHQVDPEPKPLSTTEVEQLCRSLSEAVPWKQRPQPLLPARLGMQGGGFASEEILDACTNGELCAIERCRLGHHLGLFQHMRNQVLHCTGILGTLVSDCRRADGSRVDLRDLSAALSWCGFESTLLARSLLTDFWSEALAPWQADQVWPYFTDHLDVLSQGLGFTGGGHLKHQFQFEVSRIRKVSYRVLQCFPQAPDALLADLWKAALGTAKTERELAQASLEQEAEVDDKLVYALGDGKQDVRAEAARWLARRRATNCAPQIRSALEKEKRDIAKAAMLGALEAFGESIDSFLDREALLGEAEKGIKKALPKGMEWVGELSLPDVRWRDSGEHVDPTVVAWWLVKSARSKNPAPDPLLQRYCAILRRDDAELLGEKVLVAWIDEDTRSPASIPPHLAQSYRQQAQNMISHFGQYYKGQTVESLYQTMVKRHLNQPTGSAVKSKGVLALAAAAGGPQLVPHVERYLKTWYGWRAAQCRALLHVLAWCDAPLATQHLLSVAGRFRTASIRKEADRLVHELAERQGWTMDELADRTAPSAGFDHQGQQQLEYLKEAPIGQEPEVSRTVTLQLDGTLGVHILVGGKELKSLPAARKDENEASVAKAKKGLTQAKRNLKQIVKQQTSRLYAAMCSQRTWPDRDWRRFVLQHPVNGCLARRLVWLACDDDEAISFRPLADGSLSDVDDNEVVPPAGAGFAIAHRSLLVPDLVDAWVAHLADYEVDPLFEQLGADAYELSAKQTNASELVDLCGHMVSAFKLRARAKKRGYVRGPNEDGSWFMTYQKSFPTLDIDVVLSFSGNRLPEEDTQVALISLRFDRRRYDQGSAAASAGIPLGQVPPVLLAETFHDMSLIAADGSGFDPDWEKKVR